jgi:NDP-sugar pyrophosphorylase family protein
VTRFQEKPPPEEVFTNRANAGVYVLEPEILRHIPPGAATDFAKDIFPDLLNTGIIYACPFTGYLQDTGTPEAYRQANWDVLSGKTGDRPAAPDGLLAGPGARIAPTASFAGRNVLGAKSVVEAGAFLAENILWEGCHIGVDASVTGAVLGRNVTVGDGAVVGDGVILADGVKVAAGARVPQGARAAPGETIG